jgi:hypothetical protein
MHPQITSAVLASAQQGLLRDAARSRTIAAARGTARRPTPEPLARRARPRLYCWLRDTWSQYVDLASPWGPISASGSCEG